MQYNIQQDQLSGQVRSKQYKLSNAEQDITKEHWAPSKNVNNVTKL